MFQNLYIPIRNIVQISRLWNLLDVREEERKVVLYLLAYSSSIGVGIYIYYTTATTIFLSRFDSAMLPIAYIVGGVFVHLIGRVNKYIQQYVKFSPLSIILIVTLIVSLSVLLLCHTLFDSKWVIFCIYLWIRANLFVFTFTFWVSASKLFDLNQAKRLYSLIGTGEVMASITANFLVKTLISSKVISVDGLLYIALAFIALSLYFMVLITRRYGEKLGLKKASVETTSTESVRVSRNYSLLMYSLGTIPIACLYIIEYSFSITSKLYFPDKEQLAIFLGQFLFICSIIELLVKGILFQFVTRTYGIMSGLIIMPLALSIVSLLLFLMLGFDINTFFLILISRFLITSVRRSFSDTSYQLLYQPLNNKDSIQLQNQVETYAKPGGYVLAGLSLLILIKFNLGSTLFIYSSLFLFLLIWSILVFIMQKEYRLALLTILSSIKIKLYESNKAPEVLDTNDSNRLSSSSPLDELANLSLSNKKEDRIKAAIELGRTGRLLAYKYINKLLEDNEVDVRIAAIGSATKLGKPETIPALLNNLLIPETREAAKQAICTIGDPVIPYIDTYMGSYAKQTEILTIFIDALEAIGSPNAIRLLRSKIVHPSIEIIDHIIDALNNLGYKPNTSEELFLMNIIDSKVNMFLWTLSAEIDLQTVDNHENLINLLRIEQQKIMLKLLTTLSYVTGEKRILKLEKLIYNQNSKTKSYLSDLITILIKQKEILAKVSILFENISHIETLFKYRMQYPQESLIPKERLISIVHKNHLSILTKALALKYLIQYKSAQTSTIIAGYVTAKEPILSEISLFFLKEEHPDRFNELRNYFVDKKLSNLIATSDDVIKLNDSNELQISAIEAVLESKLITDWNPYTLLTLANSIRPIYYKADKEIYLDEDNSLVAATSFVVGVGSIQVTYKDDTVKIIENYAYEDNPKMVKSIKALSDSWVYIVYGLLSTPTLKTSSLQAV